MAKTQRPSLYALGEGSMSRRTLTEAADHSGGAKATARRQGHVKQLEKPVSSHRESGGARSRITGINREIGGRRAGVGWANSSDEAEQRPWSEGALLVYISFDSKEAGAR